MLFNFHSLRGDVKKVVVLGGAHYKALPVVVTLPLFVGAVLLRIQ